MKKIILVGGGGHALSVLEMLDDVSMIAGYADIKCNNRMPIEYLGNDDFVTTNYSPNLYKIHHTLVYKNKVNLSLRRKMIDFYQDYEMHSFVAKSASISVNSKIREGVAVFEKAVINRSTIGCNSIINTGSIIEHDCKIGDNVFIAPGVIIGGGVTINSDTFVGSGAIIRDEITICGNVIIGMGSIVTRDILIPGKYYGNPIVLVESYE